ncbi:MAG: hypothetical protein N2738_01320, partial [Thermodesulfovibrionales bacterium]|nr:hypothetical protein [Thermodesulfovibrionales bacterium]
KEGQFGKIGENMVAFELSKRGWIVFLPPYDERIDIVAVKFICTKCRSQWDTTHLLTCLNTNCKLFQKDITKSHIIKAKECSICKSVFHRNEAKPQQMSCPKCNGELIESARCHNCNSPIEVKKNKCFNQDCQNTEYKVIFRTIQVKSTHLVDDGKNLGFNFKYQDLIDDERHFFVIYNRDIIENKERHFYWILSVQDFKDLKNTDTVAFKIYQNGRCHFPPSKLRDYLYDEEKTYSLLTQIKQTSDKAKLQQLNEEIQCADRFLILDKPTSKD